MNSTNSKKNESDDLICPICGEKMKEYDYQYDTVKNVKHNYKCHNCGHKSTKII